MKKFMAIALYTLYATALVLALSFGTSVAAVISDKIYELTHIASISDVTLDIDINEPLIPGIEHYVKYTANGNYIGTAGLVFESLEPEKLVVSQYGGAVKANGEGQPETFTAKMRISSKYDPDFEKVVELTFKKAYPEIFKANYFAISHGFNAAEVCIGIPIHPYSYVEKGQIYSENDYEIVYDSEYFTYNAESNELIPIKVTEDGKTQEFKVKYANGAYAVSSAFRIAPAPYEQAADFDEIRIIGPDVSGDSTNVKAGVFPLIYKNGERVISNYTISTDNEDGYVNDKGQVYFTAPGSKSLTITLPNGFSLTRNVDVQNVIKIPELEGLTLNESGNIPLDINDTLTYKLIFDTDVTIKDVKYKAEGKYIDVSLQGRVLTVVPKKTGTADMRLIIDDGYSRVEKLYKFEISGELDVFSFIAKNASLFVAKFMGHMSLFAILAFFGMYMLSFFERDGKIRRFIALTLTGLPIACLTEIIQLFLPGRTAAFSDILVDMTGFYIGAFIAAIAVIFIRIVKRKRA